MFQMSSAALGDDFVVKFAWSQAAARFILHQIAGGNIALERAVPYLPEVVAAGTSPLILVTGGCAGQACSKPWTGSTGTTRAGSSRGSWRHCTATRRDAAPRRPPVRSPHGIRWSPPLRCGSGSAGW